MTSVCLHALLWYCICPHDSLLYLPLAHELKEAVRADLQALREVGGGDADALARQAVVAHHGHRHLHAPGMLQLRGRDGVQARQQRPQRRQHLRAHAASAPSALQGACIPPHCACTARLESLL